MASCNMSISITNFSSDKENTECHDLQINKLIFKTIM